MEKAANYIAKLQWEDDDYLLSDFIRKFTLPQIVKFTKGQAIHLLNLSTTELVLLAQTFKQVITVAQCVKFKKRGRIIPVGSKLEIPSEYEGWFEILSENGIAARCIESVAELYKIRPKKCLVRKNIKAYLPKSANSEVVCDKTRTLCVGEILAVIDISLIRIKSKYPVSCLKCIARKNEIVYLCVDQKGKFSPIVEGNHIAGVHSIRNLSNMKFPLMVRLVHGKPPNGLKRSQFAKKMRLYKPYEEESIAVLPLSKNSNLVNVPLNEPLKLQVPKNWDTIMNLNDIVYLVQKSHNLLRKESIEMREFDVSHILRKNSKDFLKKNQITPSVSNSNHDVELEETFTNERKAEDIDRRYDNIDQIYDYIRGLCPPPEELRDAKEDAKTNSTLNSNAMNCSSQAERSDSSKKKPIPPSIETIPGRSVRHKGEYQSLTPANDEPVFCEFDVNDYHTYEIIRMRTSSSRRSSGIFRNDRPKRFFSHFSNSSHKFLPSPTQLRIRQKSLFVRNPIYKEESWEYPTRERSSNPPIFNLRHKSLSNADINGDDGENPEQEISHIDTNSIRRRSKSLEDVFEDTHDFSFQRRFTYFTNDTKSRKLVLPTNFITGKLSFNTSCKKVGILYL